MWKFVIDFLHSLENVRHYFFSISSNFYIIIFDVFTEFNFQFYYNLLTQEIKWNKPEEYNNIGDHLISKSEIENVLNKYDKFTLGKNINITGKEYDQHLTLNTKHHFENEIII